MKLFIMVIFFIVLMVLVISWSILEWFFSFLEVMLRVGEFGGWLFGCRIGIFLRIVDKNESTKLFLELELIFELWMMVGDLVVRICKNKKINR